MKTSASPCVAGRSSVATAAVSIVDPDTSVQDQPTPRRNNATSRSADQPASERAARTEAMARITPPIIATTRPPHRSTAAPTTGDSTYMPRMWIEMTKPMTSSSACPCFMWIGVITMTLTMTRCPNPMTSTARSARVFARITEMPRRIEPSWLGASGAGPVVVPSASPAVCRCSSCLRGLERAGSQERVGTQQAVTTSQASRKPAKREEEAASQVRDSDQAGGRDAGPMRFGPATEPIVVAQTTIERSRPRWAGSARSAAACEPGCSPWCRRRRGTSRRGRAGTSPPRRR